MMTKARTPKGGGGLKCCALPHACMRRAPALVFLLLLIPSLLALSIVDGEVAGDIAFSSNSISLASSNPTEGDDLDMTITLTNNANAEASGVQISLHPDSTANPAFHSETVAVPASGFLQVDATWQSVPFGTHLVVLQVTHSNQTASVDRSFTASGLADLVVSSLQISPSSGLHANDLVNITCYVSNQGNADAASSHLLLELDGTMLTELSVALLPMNQTVQVFTSFNAPPSGNHELIATANSQTADGVTESDTSNNMNTQPVQFTVLPEPDYHHHPQSAPEVLVSTPTNALEGPWTLSGQILRMGGEGSTSIEVGISVAEAGGDRQVRLFNVNFSEAEPLASWSQIFTPQELLISEPGDYTIIIDIDPNDVVAQSIPFNDVTTTTLTLHPEPNVVVSQYAAASSSTVMPGDPVSFNVTVTNIGILPVFGSLHATLDGTQLTSKQGLALPSGVESTYTFTAPASGDANEVLQFIATWEASEGSYDSASDDNTATGSVTLRTDLRLRFLQNTETWTPNPPLRLGETYSYTIDVISDDGSGTETFTCLDHTHSKELGTRTLTFSESGDSASMLCEFTAERTGSFELYVLADGDTVAAWTSSWSVTASGGTAQNGDGGSDWGGILLLFAGALFLGGVLLAAVVLTRAGESDAERETYDYCPACEGELVGEEDQCPHCDFDLLEGLSQFHDCEECEAAIPDLMEHCPYCGASQDISEFYEKRVRKEVPLALEPEQGETEEDEDEDEIVIGTEEFSEQLTSMGWSEEQYESDWDEQLSKAEEELDDAAAWHATQAELTEDESEDMIVETSLRRSVEEERADLDSILGDKGERRHLLDEQVDLTASDANIRADIYDITGEEGVLPGDHIRVDMTPDSMSGGEGMAAAREEIDFAVDDDGPPVSIESPPHKEEPEKRRRSVSRRKRDNTETDSA